jgi:lipoprotein-anchoring transpeptidase ErfK/SrfK
MHRFSLVLVGAAASVIALASAAQAYEGSFFFDPPARQTQVAVPQNEPGAEDQAADPYAYADPYAGGADTRAMASPIPREVVDYEGSYAPGTIVVSTAERRLYLVLPNHQALRYGVGVGRPGFEWSGVKTITAKREWPDWTPPAAMLRRRPDLPRHMAGGIDNPLGARAMYLGSSEFRIHGSNEPDTIGQAVSSGCIRMTNDDVADLYERVKVGTRVVVQR